MMRVRAGTSGFAYKEWKGGFTFYRLPKASVVAHWGAQVSGDFVFAIKASQRRAPPIGVICVCARWPPASPSWRASGGR
jgi:uncharacterized protein YecE (DUF72 family)